MEWTRLYSERGTVVFGVEPFILTGLVSVAPAMRGGELGERTVEIQGCIVPGGAEAETRRAEMERGRRLLCRVVCGGEFRLWHAGREIRLRAVAAPDFRTDAPWNGVDAASFVIRSVSVGEHAYVGAEQLTGGWGLRGALIFPLALTEETVFGLLASEGEIRILNPGDMPCGFAAEIRADGGALESAELSLGGDVISVAHGIPDGEALVIDTRAGQKGVWCGAESVMADVDWESEFFPLPPGESVLRWSAPGSGHAVVEVHFTPRYAVGG